MSGALPLTCDSQDVVVVDDAMPRLNLADDLHMVPTRLIKHLADEPGGRGAHGRTATRKINLTDARCEAAAGSIMLVAQTDRNGSSKQEAPCAASAEHHLHG